MNHPENGKWLDKALSETIGSEKSGADFEEWKQKHPQAVEMLTARADKGASASPSPLSIRKLIMKSPITKLAAAAAIIIAVTLSINLWDKSTPSAYAFEQTVEAMKGKQSFHIQTYWQKRRKDEYWAEFDEEGKLIRFRQEEGMGPRDTIVTLWENSIRSHYYPPPWSIHLKSRVENTSGGLEGLEEFDPETIVQEIDALVADGKAVIEVQDPPPYVHLKTIHVTRTDGKALKQVLVVNPDTKFVVRVDNYWGEEGEEVSHKGIEVLEYNEAMDPRLFDPAPSEGTLTIDQVSQEVGLAQADMSNEELACEIVRQLLEAWAAADYVKAGKLLGGAPPKLFLREHYRSLQPVSIASIGRAVLIEDWPVRVKCRYKVKRDGQVKSVNPTFTIDEVDGHRGRWYVLWYIWPQTEE